MGPTLFNALSGGQPQVAMSAPSAPAAQLPPSAGGLFDALKAQQQLASFPVLKNQKSKEQINKDAKKAMGKKGGQIA